MMAKLAFVYASHSHWPLHLKDELSAFRTRLESLRSVLHSNRTVKPHPSPVPNAMSSALKTRKSNGGANATATANTTGNRDRPGKVYRRAMRMGGGGGGADRKVSWGENDVQVAVSVRGDDSEGKVAAV